MTRRRVWPERAVRYELTVVAAELAPMVSGIGGWLFDRAMAGWRVGVATGPGDGADAEDAAGRRALGILGVKAIDPESLSRSAAGDDEAVAMTAISVDRLESDDLVRDLADAVIFGCRAPDGLTGQLHQVHYRPSAAALAFKAHAAAVLGYPRPIGTVETMFRYGRPAGLLDSDLVPVC
ncbi:hypothetical protein A5740_07275 [Mycobacterium sp. GA-1841]|nr:hypothetical protein A5740_07275 [Mycobacterium sp. GA-1841]